MTQQQIIDSKARKINRLGVQPEFEGIVIPRHASAGNGLEEKVRHAILFDAAEGAFAYFNQRLGGEKYWHLTETIRYILGNIGNEKRVKLPVLEGWVTHYSVNYRTGRERTIDGIAEEIWKDLEKGVRREHEGMDKFLTTQAIGGEFKEPHLTPGGIWYADVGRRGDERLERKRNVRLANAEIRNGNFNISGLEFTFSGVDSEDTSPLHRENLGRERRHGDDPEVLHLAGYHVQVLIYWINGLSPEKKIEKGLSPNYKVLAPYDFTGHEFLVVEAVARRYMPIRVRLKSQVSSISAVSAYINDHPEIFSPEIKQAIEKRLAWVGVGKYKFEDEPDREVLGSIEKLLGELGYRFNGFALNFRRYGEQYPTVSPVFSTEDASRNVHIIYDSNFNVPPLLLVKFTQAELEKENSAGRRGWNVEERVDTSPFGLYNHWRPDFDRHSQRWLVTRLTRPHQIVLAQYPELGPRYASFEQRINK